MKLNIETIHSLEQVTGSDFYVLKSDEFENNLNIFNNSFKQHYGNFRIGYSYKTNYIPYVCKIADSTGAYAEIVSEMELMIARNIGVTAENIIYNGPGKSKESLEFCLLNGSKINIDNFSELNDIVDITSQHPDKQFKIGIRLNVDLNDSFYSRFGLAPGSEDIERALNLISEHGNIILSGLHTHSTRPDKSPEIFKKKLEALISFAGDEELKDLDYIDIGGGFYGPMDDEMKAQFEGYVPDIEEYGESVGKLMKTYCPDESIELIIEPGVSVAANILDYFTRITDIKTINHKHIALTTGSFHNIKPSGHKKNLGLNVYSAAKNKQGEQIYDVVGYTCLEYDYLYHGFKGKLTVGDYLQFKNVGAYTLVFKPPFIKPAPPILTFINGEAIMVRQRELFENIFKSYSF